jgi:hypothetical protein
MKIGEGQVPPDGVDWVMVPEAARIWTRAYGRPITPHTVRRWIARGDWRMAKVGVWHVGDRHLIDRQSLLDALERFATNMLTVVHEEREKND